MRLSLCRELLDGSGLAGDQICNTEFGHHAECASQNNLVANFLDEIVIRCCLGHWH